MTKIKPGPAALGARPEPSILQGIRAARLPGPQKAFLPLAHRHIAPKNLLAKAYRGRELTILDHVFQCAGRNRQSLAKTGLVEQGGRGGVVSCVMLLPHLHRAEV